MNWKFWKVRYKPHPNPLLGKEREHREAEWLIQKSLDMPLSAGERQRLDRHLASCDACRTAWEDYRRLTRTADKWVSAASTDPGDDFTLRIMAELGLSAEAVSVVEAPSTEPTRPNWNMRTGWVVAGVAVAVLVVAGMFLPSIGHYQAQVNAYVPSMTSMTTQPVWKPETFTAVTNVATSGRQQLAEALTSIGSMSWSIYAFLIALAANVAMASVARSRRRAI